MASDAVEQRAEGAAGGEAHILGSLAGAGLLFLAWGVQRRLDAAYLLTLALLGFGIIASILLKLTLGYLLIEKVAGHPIFLEHGPLFIMAAMAILAGIQLISTGLIGEILTRVYFEGQQRRIYSVSRIIGRSRKAGIL